MAEPRAYRSIFISDFHLATRGCKADFLLDFLKHHESDYLYLVGDIIDGWRLKKSMFWPQQHNDVIQKLLRKARKGTRVFYLPGNHDEAMHQFLDMHFGGVVVQAEAIHTAGDGKRYLIMHGDRFDGVVKHARWLAHLGSSAYETVLRLNTYFNALRRTLGLKYWSLSQYLKDKTKQAMEFSTNYKLAMVTEAHRRGFDGVICGHVHRAEIQNIDGILYCNDGDWVESCTALVEHFDGRLELLTWDFVAEAASLQPQATHGEVAGATA